MTVNARAQAVYDQIAANDPNFGQLSSAEKSALLTRLQQIWGLGDLVYIQGNADVLPVAHSGENLSAPTGQPVTIPSTASTGSPSTGATTSDEPCVGKGSIQ